jgi:hypothetical protein
VQRLTGIFGDEFLQAPDFGSAIRQAGRRGACRRK